MNVARVEALARNRRGRGTRLRIPAGRGRCYLWGYEGLNGKSLSHESDCTWRYWSSGHSIQIV